MRIFKNKILRRIISVLLLICFFILFDTGMKELLSPIYFADYFIHDIELIEKSGQDVDILFIGASRTLKSFAPQIFENIMGVNCVLNAGSGAQPICATYYELKDLIERVHPHRVFIGVAWDLLKSSGTTQGKLVVYDRLSLANKLLMAMDCFSWEEKCYMSATYRFKDNFTIEKIMSNIEEKNALISSNFLYHHLKTNYYSDKGFVVYSRSYETGNIPIKKPGSFSEKKIKEENLKYLDACIELCQKNGIEVSLVSGATSVMRLYSIGNYQKAVDYFKNYAEKWNIAYYNLNYLVGREDFLPDECMFDDNHVNANGAYKLSEKLAEILLKADQGEDVSSYFYKNLKAMKKDVHRIVAVGAEFEKDSNKKNLYHATVTSLQNDDVEVIYRLLGKRNGEDEFEVLHDWTNETQIDFSLKAKTKYTLRIEAASPDESYQHAFQEYSYKSK